MTRDPLDFIFRLAYVEGALDLHGAYERAVGRRVPGRVASDSFRLGLLRKLEEALAASTTTGEVPLTVGMYLRKAVSSGSFRGQEIQERLGVRQNIFRMLERDRISPLKIPWEVWRRFRLLFRLSAESLEELLRRTHRLVYFQPSFRSTLARYDSKAPGKKRGRALEQATAELYARADLPLPLQEKEKLDELLSYLRGEFQRKE